MLDVLRGYGEEVILLLEFVVDLIIDLSDIVFIRVFLGLVNLLSGHREPLLGLLRGTVGSPQEFLVARLLRHLTVLKRVLGGRLVIMLPASTEPLLRAMRGELGAGIEELLIIILVGPPIKVGLHAGADFICLLIKQL